MTKHDDRRSERERYVYAEVKRRYATYGFDLDALVDAELAANDGKWTDAEKFFDGLQLRLRAHTEKL